MERRPSVAAAGAHARGGRALQALVGIERFPAHDTIRNLFKRFRQRRGVEFFEALWAWQLERLPERERRLAVIRERVGEVKHSRGRKLLEVPGYTFRILVTSREDRSEDLRRDYNRRADVEKRIAELRYDLADDYGLHELFAPEAALCAILMLFNRLAEFQRALGMPRYREPVSLRVEVFLCGAILGRAGHRTALHVSSAWGGLERRNALFDSLLTYFIPTSPKLNLEPST